MAQRTTLLSAGWVLAYFSGHALAHWTVGRLGGIRFAAYGVHGTTNPAGPLATLSSSLGIPAYGVARGVPHAGLLLGVALAWMAGMLVAERAPHSDLSRTRSERRTPIHDGARR